MIRRYAIMLDDRLVGVCGLARPQFSGVELTIGIFDAGARGKGIGEYCVRTLCEIAFRELGIHRVELGVYPDNAVAIHTYEKCGFQREAIARRYIYHDGAWRDLLWMSLISPEM